MTNTKIFTLVLILFTLTMVSCGNSSQKGESGNKAMQQENTTEQQNMEQPNNMTGEEEAATEEAGKEKMEEPAAMKEEVASAGKEENEASEKPDKELVAKGKELFNSNCTSCHTIGKGKLVGPDLLGVTDLRSDQWLHKWIKNPDQMLQSDPVAKELLKEFMVPMPNLGLTDQQVTALIAYLKSENKKD